LTQAAIRDDLVAVLGHYALGELSTVQRVERGFVNDNWIVKTDHGRFFVKRRHPDLRRHDVIRAQHELLRWLQQTGFPAPALLPTLHGQTLLVLGGEFFEIQRYIEGEPYDHDRPAHLEEAALTLGRYHTCVQRFSSQVLGNLGPLYSPAKLKSVLAGLIAGWGLDRDPELASIVHRLRAHASELASCFAGHGTLPHLVIHGDYYAGNLLFDGDRIVGVVDWPVP
jgi:homoserine kinase type II